MPVVKSSRRIWIWLLPGSSAGHFLVVSSSASRAKGNRKIEKSELET